jgi:hypothetical protein
VRNAATKLGLTRFAAVGVTICAFGLAQAGIAEAEYDAGHYAHGIMLCGVPSPSGWYAMGTTAPTMIPDVPNQLIAFRDELWNNSGGSWHAVLTSPWEYKRAPSDIFTAATQKAFVTYGWYVNNRLTNGYWLYSVKPGRASWAIRQVLYWYPQSYTESVASDLSLDIFTRATATRTVLAQRHSKVLWAYQSGLGNDGTDACSLSSNGQFG